MDNNMEENRLKDYDLEECAKYLEGEDGFNDIVESLACVSGENDGPDWHYVVKLKDGKYAYIQAGCDYTGWGCQESGTSKIGDTIEEVLIEAPLTDEWNDRKTPIKQQLLDQINGKQPYGLSV